jgi:hypothetical protein
MTETGQEQEPSLTYAREVSTRTRAFQKAYSDLLEEADKKGISEENFSKIVAAAMNEGAVPRVITGIEYRGSGVELLLIDDGVHIPDDAFDINVYGRTSDSFSAFVRLSPETKKNKNFSLTSTGLLPQMGDESPNPEVLATIDAHMTGTELYRPLASES